MALRNAADCEEEEGKQREREREREGGGAGGGVDARQGDMAAPGDSSSSSPPSLPQSILKHPDHASGAEVRVY
jgi:hypothetical protein